MVKHLIGSKRAFGGKVCFDQIGLIRRATAGARVLPLDKFR